MSVEAGLPWSYDDFQFYGLSLSGIRTAIAMPEFSLAFDVAQGYPYLLNLRRYFVTHGHLDHAAGIPYIISQKAMTSQPRPRFYMPPSLVEPMTRIMKAWSEIEQHEYSYDFIAVKENQEIEISRNYFVKPFKTFHRIESYGYTLFNRRTKLRTELQGLSKDEIIKKRAEGVNVTEVLETPLVSFTGDTQIEFLHHCSWVKKSKILFLEATYLESEKPIESARAWGHTHLDEIIPLLPQLECERIVIIHVSSRYSTQRAWDILKEKIPVAFHERVVLFPGR